MQQPYLVSLREFAGKTVNHVYTLGVGVLGGVLGIASAVYTDAKPKASPLVPLWLWLSLLVGGVLVAMFRAFHDVLVERDEVRKELTHRLAAVRDRLVLDDVLIVNRGTPVSSRVGLRLVNMSLEPLRFHVETLEVEVDGDTISDPQFMAHDATLAPNQRHFYWFPWFDFHLLHSMVGEVSYRITYNHASAAGVDPKFQVTHRFRFECLDSPGRPLAATLMDLEPAVTTEIST